MNLSTLPPVGKEFAGRVDFVDPVVQLPGRTITVKAQVPNPRRELQAGMFIEVRLATAVRANAVVVPENAVLPLQGATYIWVVAGQKATRRQVDLGVRSPGFVEVKTGVDVGEQVVVGGRSGWRRERRWHPRGLNGYPRRGQVATAERGPAPPRASVCLTMLLAGVALAPELSAQTTRPERTAFRETSSYSDVIGFLDSLERAGAGIGSGRSAPVRKAVGSRMWSLPGPRSRLRLRRSERTS